MEFGYARISSQKQNITRQIRNIQAAYPHAKIYQEEYTGTKVVGRKQWVLLSDRVRPGDVIIFDSVSRMSRNASDGVALYQGLMARGIDLVFLKEPQINTETYRKAMERQISVDVRSGDAAADKLMTSVVDALNEYVLALAARQIELAFDQAEKEVTDLHQRTAEGIETARRNGKQIGRRTGTKVETKKAREAKDVIRKHSRSFGGTLTDTEVLKILGISRNSYYKYKLQLVQEESAHSP